MLFATGEAYGQHGSVGLNVGELLSLGTVSAEGSVALNQHFSMNAGISVNPWTFNKGTSRQIQHRKQEYSLGMRWWPCEVYSGWWLSARAQYQEYNRGGLVRAATEEGDAVGLALGAGFSLPVAQHLNIDFGAMFWSGYKWYKMYSCPKCGRVVDSGEKAFVLPNSLVVSLVYEF